jgi:hypothetical protein
MVSGQPGRHDEAGSSGLYHRLESFRQEPDSSGSRCLEPIRLKSAVGYPERTPGVTRRKRFGSTGSLTFRRQPLPITWGNPRDQERLTKIGFGFRMKIQVQGTGATRIFATDPPPDLRTGLGSSDP